MKAIKDYIYCNILIVALYVKVRKMHKNWKLPFLTTPVSFEASSPEFIFIFHGTYASIYYSLRDIAAYWLKIATPLYSAPPLGVKPSDLRNNPWRWKTRTMGLSDGERISMIHSAVLLQIMRVTDGQMDGIAVAYTCYSNKQHIVACKNDYKISLPVGRAYLISPLPARWA